MKLVKKRTFVLSILVLGLLGRSALANLLANGSFETPLAPIGGFTNFTSGSTAITGWTVVGPEVSVVSGTYISQGFAFPAENGTQWLDLTGDLSNALEGIEQGVATVPGTSYHLSYFVGNQVDPGGSYGTTSTVEVLVNGSVIQVSTNSGGAGTATQNWEQFQISFTADSATSVIEFLNLDPPTDNTNGLDDIVLTGAASTVPEPSTFPLLVAAALGFAGFVAYRKTGPRARS